MLKKIKGGYTDRLIEEIYMEFKTALTELAKTNRGEQKVIMTWGVLNRIFDSYTDRLIEAINYIPLTTYNTVDYPNGNIYPVVGEEGREKEVETVLRTLFERSRFSISFDEALYSNTGKGKKGLSYKLANDFPKGTRKKVIEEEWETFYDMVIAPLKDDKQFWIAVLKKAKKEATKAHEEFFGKERDRGFELFKSKGVEGIENITITDIKQTLTNVLKSRGLTLRGEIRQGDLDSFERAKDPETIELLLVALTAIYGDREWFDEFINKLKQRTKTVAKVGELPDWVKGLVGDFLGKEAPLEVVRMNPQVLPAERAKREKQAKAKATRDKNKAEKEPTEALLREPVFEYYYSVKKRQLERGEELGNDEHIEIQTDIENKYGFKKNQITRWLLGVANGKIKSVSKAFLKDIIRESEAQAEEEYEEDRAKPKPQTVKEYTAELERIKAEYNRLKAELETIPKTEKSRRNEIIKRGNSIKVQYKKMKDDLAKLTAPAGGAKKERKPRSDKGKPRAKKGGEAIEGVGFEFKPPKKPRVPPLKAPKREEVVEGAGLNVGYTTENQNGLAHIYPMSRDMILEMLSCCPP